MNPQPKALVLADALEELDVQFSHTGLCGEAADELRRLYVWEKTYEAVCDERDAISLQRGYGMSRESIEEAIEVLEDASAEMLMETGDKNYYIEAIAVLRQALVDADDTSQERVDEIVKDEHEPVAWANSFDLQNFDMKVRTDPDLHHTVPLYTAPPKQWVGLTDEEVSEIIDREIGFNSCWGPEEKFARAIEQALKEKNT